MGARGRALVAALAAALIAFGLFVSFRYSLSFWGPDADTAVPLSLWEGFSRHGWSFLTTWRFTPDNWLLSLVPLVALFQWLSDGEPLAITAMGWMIFVASVAMTSALAWRVAGRGAALALAVVLLFANPMALGPPGFLAAPVSHDISMAWALLALLLSVRSLEARSALAAIPAAALAGLAVFADVLSDPWAGPAVGLPLAIAGGALAVVRRGSSAGRAAALVAIAAAAAFAAAYTRLFGLLDFLPEPRLDYAGPSAIGRNLAAAGRSLVVIGNVVPRRGELPGWAQAIDAAALGVLLAGAVALTAAGLRRAPPARQLVAAVAILSIGGVGLAFALGDWPSLEFVARWFPNLYYFGALLVAIALTQAGGRLRLAARAAAFAYAALFVVAGCASAPGLWAGRGAPRAGGQTVALGHFLQNQGLRYGYGPYWGTHALAMGLVTRGRVVIRPVSFNAGAIHRREAETSPYWYEAADEPKDTPVRFVVIRNDGETCPDVEACAALAAAQFGPPARRLSFGDAVILVWPHPISDRIGK